MEAGAGGGMAGSGGGGGGGEWINVGEQKKKKGEALECVGGMERRSQGGCGSWW